MPAKKLKLVPRIVLAGAIVLIAILFMNYLPGAPGTRPVCFSTTCISAEIADTPEERNRGLMFRTELAEDKGMLFIFETEGLYSFWMKNTLIPLDMIWIGQNFNIVHIEHAVPCTTEPCESYTPDTPAKYVVEAVSGFADAHNVKVGDSVALLGNV